MGGAWLKRTVLVGGIAFVGWARTIMGVRMGGVTCDQGDVIRPCHTPAVVECAEALKE